VEQRRRRRRRRRMKTKNKIQQVENDSNIVKVNHSLS